MNGRGKRGQAEVGEETRATEKEKMICEAWKTSKLSKNRKVVEIYAKKKKKRCKWYKPTTAFELGLELNFKYFGFLVLDI